MKAVNLLAPEHEHEFEAAEGLPEQLPAGERLLWQGSPDPLGLARQALHVDTLLIYFGALVAWRIASGLHDGESPLPILHGLAGMLTLSVLAIGLLSAIAWLMARTTCYSITNKRVVMRVGVVLSITFNLPYSQIAAAQLRARRGGQGDIALSLQGDDRIAYLHLWPHVRPWRLRHTEPLLRALPQADAVARILATAWAEAKDGPAAAASVATPPSDDNIQPLPLRPVRLPPSVGPASNTVTPIRPSTAAGARPAQAA